MANESQKANIQLPEFKVDVSRLPKLGNTIKLSLNDPDINDSIKADLTEFIDVLSLDKLNVQLVFKNWVKDGVQVEGTIEAKLNTECPISLKPVSQNINSEFNARFVPPTSSLANPHYNEDGEMVFEIDGDDLPDIFEGESLDAWAIATEHLMLEIDYFARAEGVEFEPMESQEEGEGADESPFAKLKALKQ